MEIKLETKATIELRLTEKEARWLIGIMQNPIHSDETNQDRDFRQMFFNFIREALPKPNSV